MASSTTITVTRRLPIGTAPPEMLYLDESETAAAAEDVIFTRGSETDSTTLAYQLLATTLITGLVLLFMPAGSKSQG
jgi:hypothetical protein